MKVKIKRVYEQAEDGDGVRILVDRLWPRGLKKEEARVDLWLKEIAPTTELRQWFAHDPGKWQEFRKRYLREIEAKEAQVERIKQEMKKGPVTLVYGARDSEHNDAVVLQELLNG
jgi:uncharacterized protein YeaO (DUF488 family)